MLHLLQILQQGTFRILPIEISLVSGKNITKIPDQPQLANTIVTRIHALNAADITLTPLTGGTPIAAADFAKANLKLFQGSQQKGLNIPLPLLHDQVNGTPTPYKRKEMLFYRWSISWTQSQVILQNATWSQDEILTLMVEYAYPEDLGFQTVDQVFNAIQGRPNIEVQNREA